MSAETMTQAVPAAAATTASRRGFGVSGGGITLSLYLIFLMLPIYWLVIMSLKTNAEITSGMTLWPQQITFDNYRTIFTDASWYNGYINSLSYVAINTVLSIGLALPAAYAFSRYRFLGDKHLFFWLLSNRMAPPAIFALPFFNLYSAIGLALTVVSVRASRSSTQENMKQKKAVTPMPLAMIGMKILAKKRGKE